jgi:hypothetical protein
MRILNYEFFISEQFSNKFMGEFSVKLFNGFELKARYG